MRALVTGGAGFVGTNLIKRLSNNNHVEYRENIIVSVDNYSTGLKENEIDCPGVEYFDVDILGDVNGDFHINVLDVVALMQYILNPQDYPDFPIEKADMNGDGVANVLDAVALVNEILGQ